MGCGLGDCQHFHKGKKKNLPAPAARIQLEEKETDKAFSDTGQRPKAALHPDNNGD
jgi:hypothetical protein